MRTGEWRMTCCLRPSSVTVDGSRTMATRRGSRQRINKPFGSVGRIEISEDFVRRRGLDLSVIGLGKLGSPMVACFAAKGHRVIGVDLNERFVRLLNEGKPPVFEPGLEDLLKQSGGRLRATTDIAEAVAHSDITFMIVP